MARSSRSTLVSKGTRSVYRDNKGTGRRIFESICFTPIIFFRKLYNVVPFFHELTLIGILVLLSFVGGMIFRSVEAPREKSITTRIMLFRNQLLDDLYSQKSNADDGASAILDEIEARLQKYENMFIQAIRNGTLIKNGKADYLWTLSGSIYFCMTVYTLLGWGDVVPKSILGRFLTFIYACITIPIGAIVLEELGNQVIKVVYNAWWLARSCFRFCGNELRVIRGGNANANNSLNLSTQQRKPEDRKSKPANRNNASSINLSSNQNPVPDMSLVARLSALYKDSLALKYSCQAQPSPAVQKNRFASNCSTTPTAKKDNRQANKHTCNVTRAHSKPQRKSPSWLSVSPLRNIVLGNYLADRLRCFRRSLEDLDLDPICRDTNQNAVMARRDTNQNTVMARCDTNQNAVMARRDTNQNAVMARRDTNQNAVMAHGPNLSLGHIVTQFQKAEAAIEHEKVEDPNKAHQPPKTLIMVVTLVYIAGGSAVISRWVKMNIPDTMWFVFITVSTIGFGDVVPPDKRKFAWLLPYIFVGLCLLTNSFQAIIQYFTASVGQASAIINDINAIIEVKHAISVAKKKSARAKNNWALLRARVKQGIPPEMIADSNRYKQAVLAKEKEMIRRAYRIYFYTVFRDKGDKMKLNLNKDCQMALKEWEDKVKALQATIIRYKKQAIAYRKAVDLELRNRDQTASVAPYVRTAGSLFEEDSSKKLTWWQKVKKWCKKKYVATKKGVSRAGSYLSSLVSGERSLLSNSKRSGKGFYFA